MTPELTRECAFSTNFTPILKSLPKAREELNHK